MNLILTIFYTIGIAFILVLFAYIIGIIIVAYILMPFIEFLERAKK